MCKLEQKNTSELNITPNTAIIGNKGDDWSDKYYTIWKAVHPRPQHWGSHVKAFTYIIPTLGQCADIIQSLHISVRHDEWNNL